MKQARKKHAREKAKWIACGVDVQKLVCDLWRLGRRLEPKLVGYKVPELTLHRSKKAFSSGYTYYLRKIHITAGTSLDDLRYVAAHEVAHSIAYLWKCKTPHDDIFKAAQAELLRAAGIRNTRLTRASIQAILDEASQQNPKVEV